MKKLFIIICALVVGIANADNVITSKEYVDTQGATLQPQVQAKNTNTVLTYPAAGTAAPGEKAIYDASAAYGEQTDALVTAGQFNNALQVALDTEFVCVSRNDQGCLLYEIHSASQKQTLPAGYTQLEYIYFDGASTTGGYIDTGLTFYTDIPNNKIKFAADAKVYPGDRWQVIVGGAGAYSAFIGPRGDTKFFWYGAGFQDTSTNVQNPYTKCSHWFDTVKGVYTVHNSATNAKIVDINFTPVLKQNIVPILIGGYSWGGKTMASHRTQMDLYSVKIYNDNTLSFNGVPCRRDSDGVVGLFDTVSQSFKTNAEGTTALTAGPVFSYLPQGN